MSVFSVPVIPSRASFSSLSSVSLRAHGHPRFLSTAWGPLVLSTGRRQADWRVIPGLVRSRGHFNLHAVTTSTSS